MFQCFAVFTVFTVFSRFTDFTAFGHFARIRGPAPGAARGWAGKDVGPVHHGTIARLPVRGVNRRDVARRCNDVARGDPGGRPQRSRTDCRRRLASHRLRYASISIRDTAVS